LKGHFKGCLINPCYCDSKRYKLILAISVPILILEILGGIISGSLALFADAAHVFHDLLAVTVAIIVEWGVKTRGKPEKEWRAVGGYINAALLATISFWIIIEAIDRFLFEYKVVSGIMIWTATLGAIGNYFQHRILASSISEHVTHKGVSLHVLSDFWQSIAVVLTGIVIAFTGLFVFDIVISVVIALVFFCWSIKLFSLSRQQQIESEKEA